MTEHRPIEPTRPTVKSFALAGGVLLTVLSLAAFAVWAVWAGWRASHVTADPPLHRSAVSPDGTWSFHVVTEPTAGGIGPFAEVRDAGGAVLLRRRIGTTYDMHGDARSDFAVIGITDDRAWAGSRRDREAVVVRRDGPRAFTFVQDGR